jgi:hypothetical protein
MRDWINREFSKQGTLRRSLLQLKNHGAISGSQACKLRHIGCHVWAYIYILLLPTNKRCRVTMQYGQGPTIINTVDQYYSTCGTQILVSWRTTILLSLRSFAIRCLQTFLRNLLPPSSGRPWRLPDYKASHTGTPVRTSNPNIILWLVLQNSAIFFLCNIPE